MVMKISDAGVLSGGEYEEVQISGSVKIEGGVRCRTFLGSGAVKGEGELSCEEKLVASGSTEFDGSIRAGNALVTGSLKCAALSVEAEARLSGSVNLEGKLSGGDIWVSGGSLRAGEGIEAESFHFSGSGYGPNTFGSKLDCEGLLNAETVKMTLGQGHYSVSAIGGGTVTVKGAKEEGPFSPFGGFPGFTPFGAPWGKPPQGSLNVTESIEADRVELENTVCPLVTGRTVKIGKGCKIGTVRYSESLDLDPKAQVEKQEKL